jgi:hypothetical protein
VTCAEAREVSLSGLEEVVEPCLAALLGEVGSDPLRRAS